MSRTSPQPPSPVEARTVLSHDGTRIVYDLYAGTTETAIVIIPGFWRTRRHASMTYLVERLRHHRAPIVVCDVRGHGESGGTFGFNREEHHDLAAVITDLVEHTPVQRVILVGLSYGGSIAVSTAARHDLPITALLLISPVARFTMIRPRLNLLEMHHHIAFSQALKPPRFEWRLLRRRERLEAAADVQSVHVPISLIHVKNDWLVHHGHAEAIFEGANDPRELHLLDIEGRYHADHIFRVAGDAIEPLVDAFLTRHCG